jgi:hypothetical protein
MYDTEEEYAEQAKFALADSLVRPWDIDPWADTAHSWDGDEEDVWYDDTPKKVKCGRCGATYGLYWEQQDGRWVMMQAYANGRSEMHRCNWTEFYERTHKGNPRNKAPVQRHRRA